MNAAFGFAAATGFLYQPAAVISASAIHPLMRSAPGAQISTFKGN
jgi:hypothetical protein